MAAPKLARVPLPATRTPERQALADAIAERDRRRALIADKRAEAEAVDREKWPLYNRRDDLEQELRELGGAGGEAARRDALLRGEKVGADNRADDLRAEIAKVDAAKAKANDVQAMLKSDIALLEGTLLTAEIAVERTRGDVIASDPNCAALIEALHATERRGRLLRMVLSGLMVEVQSEPFPSPSPAWSDLYRRLTVDADAAIPDPESV